MKNFLSLLIVGLLGSCAPAYAQEKLLVMTCGTQEQTMTVINGYNEEIAFQGYSDAGALGVALMQMWINPNTKSWTFTALHANGEMCILSGGNDGVAYPGVAL
jgi:hypothetical protein